MAEFTCLGYDAPLALIDELSTHDCTILNTTANPVMEMSDSEFVGLNLDGLQPVIVEEIPQVDETNYGSLLQLDPMPCEDVVMDCTLNDLDGFMENGDAQDILQLQDLNVFGDVESGELNFPFEDSHAFNLDGVDALNKSSDGSDKDSTEEENAPSSPPAPQRRRKRKSKNQDGIKTPPPPRRRRRPLKTKIYEMAPFEDPERERKRLNALNARRHRELQKMNREKLKEELDAITRDRDTLKEQLEKMMKREADLMLEIEILRHRKTTDVIC